MGRIWRVGSDVSTDDITPGTLVDTPNLADICFVNERPEFHEKVRLGDYIIAGYNFGRGSSRETAAKAIQQSGIKAVLALSYARIFRANAINIGLPVLTISEVAYGELKEGVGIYVDLNRDGEILTDDQRVFRGEMPEGTSLRILQEGGLMPYLRNRRWRYESN